jgi:hypothetical protein
MHQRIVLRSLYHEILEPIDKPSLSEDIRRWAYFLLSHSLLIITFSLPLIIHHVFLYFLPLVFSPCHFSHRLTTIPYPSVPSPLSQLPLHPPYLLLLHFLLPKYSGPLDRIKTLPSTSFSSHEHNHHSPKTSIHLEFT